jgi:hypothetical protein
MEKEPFNDIPWEGEGVEESPYLVSTGEQLFAIPDNATGHFKIMNDINVTGVSQRSILFSGKLEGSGYKIRDLRVPLFSTLTGTARIENLVLENVNNNAQGAFAVTLNTNGFVRNCHVLGGSVTSTNSCAGFITTISGRVHECSTSANVTMTNTSSTSTRYTGGFASQINANGSVENCYAIGRVASNSFINNSAGFIGNAVANSTVRMCYFGGNLGNILMPPFFGTTSASTPVSSYFESTKLGIFIPEEQARTSSQMRRQETFVDWDFESVWAIEEGVSYPYLRGLQDILGKEPEKKFSVLLEEGESTQLIVTEQLENNDKFTWISSDEGVAAVSNYGLVNALAEGRSTVTAENETGFRQTIAIRVISTVLLQLAVHLKIGETVKLDLNDGKDVTYTSSNEMIASVSIQGIVTAVSSGLVEIIAKYEGIEESIFVRVE